MYTRLFTGQIIFYYAHKTIFDNVQHQSAYMCKNIVSKEGEDLSERFTITDDEEPMFALCLTEALPDIYDVLKTLTHGIDDAFYDTITGSEIKDFDDGEETEATEETEEEAEETEATENAKPLADLDVEDSANYIVLRLNDYGAYNPNVLRIVDAALRSSIEQGALSGFYNRVTHPELTKVAAEMFAAQLRALAARAIHLRKKTTLS